MAKTTMTRARAVTRAVEKAWQDVDACFGRFCLTAGIEALQTMLADDATALCGERHACNKTREGHRWGKTEGRIYH